MKTLIHIAETQKKSLDDIARKENCSRGAVIRAAIDRFLSQRACKDSENAFGLWNDRKTDELDHQENIRNEW